jgi:hypothetical protein
MVCRCRARAMVGEGEKNPLPLVVAGSVLVFRSHFYRHIRKVIIPLGLLALYYRQICLQGSKDEMENVLAMICNYLSKQNKHLSLLGGDIFGLFILYSTGKTLANIWSHDPSSFYGLITDSVFGFIKSFPFVKQMLNQERESVDKLVDEEMKSKIRAMGPRYAVLPQAGQSSEEILNFLKTLVRKEDSVWENGKVSGAVYHGGREHQELLNAAFGLYSLANPLHPDMWPSSTKLEGEIISMTANLMTTTVKTLCG